MHVVNCNIMLTNVLNNNNVRTSQCKYLKPPQVKDTETIKHHIKMSMQS